MINKFKLNELGSVNRGKSKHRPRNAPELYGGEFPFIQTGDVKHSPFYVTEHSQTYNEKGLSQSKLWPAKTLCITIAANIADTAILSYSACFPDSIIGFLPDKEKADVKYVKYCLDTFQLQMKSISQGTTQDNMSVEKLLSIDFPAPDLKTQKKIAAILSAYDDLIENNKRCIALLEKMAEEIYREWFVRFRFPGYQAAPFEKGIPKGWKVEKLPVVADISYGFPFKANRFNSLGEGKPIIRIRNIPESKTTDFTDEIVNDKYIVNTGDFVVGMDGDFHMNHWYGKQAYLVQRVCKISAKVPILNGYLSRALRAPIKHYESILMGATVAHLGAKHLNNINIVIPTGAILEKFEIFNDIENQKKKLSLLNSRLSETKLSLLPRLISGKLSVEDLDIQFPPGMINETEAV